MQGYSLISEILLAVMRGQLLAASDPHYPGWHLAPVTGLMNDPNGFIQHNGRFHLFYQWNPLDCSHSTKVWGHCCSIDLLHWQHEPVALLPEAEYDRNGCYSGCALVYKGKLTLCYTGNVKFPDGSRTAWQCLATENSSGGFYKTGTVLAQPGGYSGHVRDPKIWYHRGYWYMVLAAQDLQQQGKVLIFRSKNLRNWHMQGELAGNGIGGLTDAGYMWECPDLFKLSDQHILLCCPQGITSKHEYWQNSNASAWLAGDLDYATGNYHHGKLQQLDAGFEFYAPHTTLADDGRRLLFGWLGVPGGEEMYQPTIHYGWLHHMTCPRELSWYEGQLCQQPIAELQKLRSKEQYWEGQTSDIPVLAINSAELQIIFHDELILDFAGLLILQADNERVVLRRRSLINGEWQERHWQGKVNKLWILCDHSSVEIFINHGAGVMSNRYFPDKPPSLIINGTATLQLYYWQLRSCPTT